MIYNSIEQKSCRKMLYKMMNSCRKRIDFIHTIFLVLLIMLFTSIIGCANSVEIIAHRGASCLAPENTLASVILAWEKDADTEIDVHLTKDNRIVAIHDATTKRTAGIDMKIIETNSQELRELEVGSYKGSSFSGEPIPFLEEIIETIQPRRRLFVEIKCGPEILPYLQQVLEESKKISQIIIIGFDLETMVLSKKRMPNIPTYWLKGTAKNKNTQDWIPHDPKLIQLVRDKGLDGLDVHYAGIDKTFINAVKAAGQKLYVWTVDDPEEAKRLIKLGVSGITTNRPEWLRNQL